MTTPSFYRCHHHRRRSAVPCWQPPAICAVVAGACRRRIPSAPFRLPWHGRQLGRTTGLFAGDARHRYRGRRNASQVANDQTCGAVGPVRRGIRSVAVLPRNQRLSGQWAVPVEPLGPVGGQPGAHPGQALLPAALEAAGVLAQTAARWCGLGCIGWVDKQYSHCRHSGVYRGMTWSPGFRLLTPAPTSTTMPAPS